MPLDVLLTDAIGHARDGYRVTRSQNRLTQDHLAELKDVPGFAATFLVDGKTPDIGATLKQEALAATLDHLAHAGLDDFYRGDVGREIAADLDRIGSPVTRDDLTRYQAKLAEPLRVDLPRGTVYNTDAPTQGVVSLMILALFDRLGVTEAESFDHIHGLVEATKRALARPRPRRHRSGLSGASARPLSRAALHRRRGDEDRPPQGGALAARRPARAIRSGWAPPTPRASSSPTSSRSTGNSAPAACCRRPAC